MIIPITSDAFGAIREKRAKSFALWLALCEIIDNSIDAGADKVTITNLDGDVVMTDNGSGFKNIPEALIIGSSTKSGKIGRFGVGLKDSSIRYSGSTIIESNGVRCVADWDRILRKSIGPEAETFDIPKTNLTKIIWKNFNYSTSIKTDMLSKVYGELISSKKLELSINGCDIEPAPLPKFEKTITSEFQYKGNTINLYGGTYLPKNQPKNHLNGYNVYYQNRQIQSTSDLGISDRSTVNFCFIVDLLDNENSEGWKLATNKDGVEGLDDVLDHIFHKWTCDLLEKAFEKQQSVELKEFVKKIKCEINGKQYNPSTEANEKRKSKAGKSGSETPTENGTPHENSETSDDGGGDRNGPKPEKSTVNHETREKCNIDLRFEALEEGEVLKYNQAGKSSKCIITFNPEVEEIQNKMKSGDSYFFSCMAKTFYYFRQPLFDDTTHGSDVLKEVIESLK